MNKELVSKRMQTSALVVVAIAVFVDMMVYGMVVPILPQYALSLGATQAEIGLLFGSYAFTLLLAAPLFGILSDRIGRKGPMLWGLLGLGGATLLFMFADSYWMLVHARMLQGVAAAVTWTAGLALLADLFPPESRGKVMGLALSGQAAGTLLGPAVGGWLFQWGGYHAPFLFAAGIALLDAMLRIVLLRNVPNHKSEPQKGTIRGLFSSRSFLIIFGIVMAGAAIPAVLEPTLPLRLERVMGASPGTIGLLFMVPTAAYALVAPFIGALSARSGNFWVIRAGLLLTAVVLPINALPDSLWMQVSTLTFLGIGMGLLLTPTLPELALAAERSGARSYGTVYAVYNTAYSAGMMVGPLVAGFLADWFDLSFSYLVIGILILAFLPLSFLGVPGGRSNLPLSK
ncbi:MAG: MFS transporter [Gorillibacterium sp.]|nr:MFS transporter [Gorillibacterium sp.]